MSNYREAFISQVLGGSIDVASQERQQSEDKLVKYLLGRFSLERLRSDILTLSGEDNRQGYMSLRAFCAVFPLFPFSLGYHSLRSMPLSGDKKTAANYVIHLDPESTEPARFKSFFKVPFMRAFRELQQHRGTERPVCLIVPRRGIRFGLAIHNDASEQYWAEGLSWVYKQLDGQRFYVQPFARLLDAIGLSGKWLTPGQ